MRPPFHLAFPVHDLDAARAFYVGVLGCREGRSAERWVDFDLAGHQLSAHLVEGGPSTEEVNAVDGDDVPVRHFGLVLARDAWDALVERVRAAGTSFPLEPRVRFEGQPGEQGTFFLRDPAGNALEFKTFRDQRSIFATKALD